MRIVVGNNTLAGPGGTETYTTTVAGHLQRLGHTVWIHASEQGALADAARRDGLRVPERAADLPGEADAVVANDAIAAVQLADRYPAAPLVLIGHSDTMDFALPPRLPGLLSGVVALYDRVERRLRGMDLEVPITRLAQPVDVELFRPLRSLPERAASVLVLGNYVTGARLHMIERACARAGLAMTHVGVHAGHQTLDPVVTLCEHDIVLGKARVVLEAMAAGRAVYSLDHNGGDGWVTAASYPLLAPDNFGGQSTDLVIDEDRLVADLGAYEPGMGIVCRDLAIRHHAATAHAAELAALLAGLAPRPRPVPGPLEELARLVRTSWQHEGRAFALGVEVERVHRRLGETDVAHRAEAEAARVARAENAVLHERLAGLVHAEQVAAASARDAHERLAVALAAQADAQERAARAEALLRERSER